MKLLYSLLLFVLLPVHFTHKQKAKVEYIVYGVYCGECFGKCVNLHELKGDTLLESADTTINSFIDYSRKGKDFKGKAINTRIPLALKKIRDSIPLILLKSRSRTFGEPDSHDQCGIFLRIKTTDSVKDFYIDPEIKSPPQLVHYIKMIK